MKADLVGLREPMKGMFMKNHYDYLVVGAGITAAVFAHEAALAGKSCLVIDRRPPYRGQYLHEGRRRHQRSRVRRSYLPHLHQARWDYVNRFAEFNNYVNFAGGGVQKTSCTTCRST